MIDLLNFRTEFSSKEWRSLCKGFSEGPIRTTSRGSYHFALQNLRIEYLPKSQDLFVRNSLHKFYNAAVSPIPIGVENYNDFNSIQLGKVINYLCVILRRKPSDLELFGRFEYGVNIDIKPHKPMEIMNSYLSLASTYANSFFTEPSRKGKPIGRSCHLSEYHVKFYDKGKQAEISKHGLLRYEIVNGGVGRLKRILGKPTVTLEDLLDNTSLQKLSDDLLRVYDLIRKMPVMNSDIPRAEMQELLAFSEPVMMAYDKKKLSKWKRVKQQDTNKALMNKYESRPNSAHAIIRKRLLVKLHELIISTPCNKGVDLNRLNQDRVTRKIEQQ
jgi:hypothetical protein